MIRHAMLLEERFRAPIITDTLSVIAVAQENDIAAAARGEGG
jgi:hypothetical protein